VAPAIIPTLPAPPPTIVPTFPAIPRTVLPTTSRPTPAPTSAFNWHTRLAEIGHSVPSENALVIHAPDEESAAHALINAFVLHFQGENPTHLNNNYITVFDFNNVAVGRRLIQA
jgi:hypothetical protein